MFTIKNSSYKIMITILYLHITPIVITMLNGTFYNFLFFFFSTYRTQFFKENLVRQKRKKVWP